MKDYQKYLLIFILLIALFSRFYRLTDIPHGFFCDEASIGYNAFKILRTGKDQNNVWFPFYFKTFDHYRNPVTVYLNILPTFIFGLSEFSVRSLAALFGILTVCLIFLIGKKMGGFWVGFFASFFLATSPWHIHMSRIGWECVYFPFFVCLGIYFWQRRENDLFWYLSFLSFGIGIYTYYPAWLIIPLLLAGLIVLDLKDIWREHRLVSGIILIFLILLPLLSGLKSGEVLVRWNEVNHHETTSYEQINSVVKTYLGHFSPEFLFQKGDSGLPGRLITRHSVKGVGEVYWYILPFMLMGIFLIVFKKVPKSGFILLLFLLYPLGSSLTENGIYATRSIIGVIPFALAPAIGIVWLGEKFRLKIRKIFYIVAIGAGLSFFVYFMNLYLNDYPKYSYDYWGWQYGPEEIIGYYMDNYDNYDEFYLEDKFNGPEIFAPFYSKDKCLKCFVGNLDKINPEKKQLFAIQPQTLESFKNSGDKKIFQEKYKILYPNLSIAYIIIEPK